MGFQAGLKGIVAQMIGGMGNVPGAIVGSLLLGLIESYGIAAFGTSYRNLFAFVVMILILVLKPNGIFSRGRGLPPEPLTGTFIAPSAPLRIPLGRWSRRSPWSRSRCRWWCATATCCRRSASAGSTRSWPSA